MSNEALSLVNKVCKERDRAIRERDALRALLQDWDAALPVAREFVAAVLSNSAMHHLDEAKKNHEQGLEGLAGLHAATASAFDGAAQALGYKITDVRLRKQEDK